jgi:spermidine/putrescine transport system substrate-binding protein
MSIFSSVQVVFLMCFAVTMAGGCTPRETQPKSVAKRVVNLAIWSSYASPELIDQFETRTGIKVQISNFSSNEELLAKVQAGGAGYDVVLPSDYMVAAMIKLDLLSVMDLKRIPQSKSLDPKLMKLPYDKENKYSLPFDWGTVGIAINRAIYHGKIKSWKDLLSQPELAGKISFLDDSREVLGMGLKALGYSLNTTRVEELKQAKELVLAARKRVKIFSSEPLASLVNGEVSVAQIYVSDAFLAGSQMGEGIIEYLIPEEGTTFWVDNFVIPRGAKNIDEAYALIDFFLEPSSGLHIATQVFAAPSNLKVVDLLPSKLKSSLAFFPSKEILSRCEMLQDLGDSLKVWDRLWTEIKVD